METLDEILYFIVFFSPVINYINYLLEMEWPRPYIQWAHRNSLLSPCVFTLEGNIVVWQMSKKLSQHAQDGLFEDPLAQ